MSCKYFDVSTGECMLTDPTSIHYNQDADPSNAFVNECLDSEDATCSDYVEEYL